MPFWKRKVKKEEPEQVFEMIYTDLPGLKGIPVIRSYPMIVRENSSKIIIPKKKK